MHKISKLEKQQRRQLDYAKRARNARLYGKVLIPVALVFMSTGLWSDPVLGPQLKEGLEDIKPILATYAQNTPLEDVFGPVPEAAATAEDAASTDEASLAPQSTLPRSVSPVNRP